MKQEELVPKRRFEEFKDPWKKEKFGQLYDIKSGNAFNRSEYVTSGVPIINGESIHYGRINIKNLNYLPKEFVEKYSNYKILPEDIVLGLNRPIINNRLKIAQVPRELKKSLLYQRAGKVEFLRTIDTDFTYHLLGNEIYKFVLKEAVGSDQPFISTTILKDWDLSIPKTEKEQQKIGQFFKRLDEMIALEQRKIDKTKALKSAYLAEMFPAEGERVPKRRFEGFTDEWKKQKLSDLGDFKSNGVNKKINQDEKPVALLNYMDVYSRKEINKSNLNELMQVTAKDSQIIENNIKKNDIFFTPTSETANDIGRIMVIEEDLPGAVYSYHLMRFRPNTKKIYSVFPNYAFATSYVRGQMEILAQGVQRFVLNRDAFEEIKVFLPSYLEQQKIGEFFKRLDCSIKNHQQKLEKLKATKQAYLHEMFV